MILTFLGGTSTWVELLSDDTTSLEVDLSESEVATIASVVGLVAVN